MNSYVTVRGFFILKQDTLLYLINFHMIDYFSFVFLWIVIITCLCQRLKWSKVFYRKRLWAYALLSVLLVAFCNLINSQEIYLCMQYHVRHVWFIGCITMRKFSSTCFESNRYDLHTPFFPLETATKYYGLKLYNHSLSLESYLTKKF